MTTRAAIISEQSSVDVTFDDPAIYEWRRTVATGILWGIIFRSSSRHSDGKYVLCILIVPLTVVVKTPDSQSGKPGSIPGHPTVNQAGIGSCPPFGAAKVKRRRRGDKHHRQMPV